MRGNDVRKSKGYLVFLLFYVLMTLAACTKNIEKDGAVTSEPVSSEMSVTAATSLRPATVQTVSNQEESKTAASGPSTAVSEPLIRIYLYGEQHGVEKILEKEAELWYEYYHDDNMRHLFVELPYYTAEFLNQWMQSENDDILDQLYDDWEGSAAHNPYIKAFYQSIKSQCPETIFHGTDVGHQYQSTGERFLQYLRDNGLESSVQYQQAQKAIEQGMYYYEQADEVYRENKMSENFAEAFDKLNGETVMGIYGSAHTALESMDMTGKVPCMANQLKAIYGDVIQSEDLTELAQRVDTITVGGKAYEASYFGKQDLTGVQDFAYREFWRLENAYEDLKEKPKAGDVLPYHNFPMSIATGQVFVVDYKKTDGSVTRLYYRSDGNEWEGREITEEIVAE